MNIFGARLLVLVILATGATTFFCLYAARRMRAEFEGLLDAKLQADLITNEANYLAAVRDTDGISILFVGDIMLSRGPEMILKSSGDYKYPFLKTADVLRSADIAFGNLENPVSARGINIGSIYSFRAKPEVVEGLEFAGFDVMSIANNHIFDWGAEAIRDTISILLSGGISPIGAGASYKEANDPVIMKVGNTRIGLLGYTTLYPQSLVATDVGAGISDISNAESAVAALRDEVDLVIVSLHWGEEYQTTSNDEQKELGRGLIDSGADVIIGHHPHVIQEIEEYNGGLIIYSLGNFVFDQSFSDATRTGMVARVTIKNKKIAGIEKLQVYISETFQPEFVNL